jgi:MSHA biogenesis protein MshM
MYLEHFGLERQPFKIIPDTSLFYKGSKRGAALEALKYAVTTGEGIVKVVGEVGSGKTMLCRMLEIELPDNVEVVYIANPSLSPDNILHVIAFELKLNVNNDSSKLEVMQKLQNYLLEKHAQGKHVVVFVEEAQSMPTETLEEIRLLSNLETNDSKLLQIVLFGQPELDDNLRQPNIRQLKERITHSFYLDPFPPKDIYDYLNFRMRAVGYRGPDIFSHKVANKIEKKSKGLTRRINILADKALLVAYSEGGHSVVNKYIEIAAKDSDFEKDTNWKPWLISVSSLAVIAFAVWVGSLLPVYLNEKDSVAKEVVLNEPLQQLAIIKAKTKLNISVGNNGERKLVNEDSSAKILSEKIVLDQIKGIIATQIEKTKRWLNKAEDNSYTIQLVLLDAWAVNKVESFLNKVGNDVDMDKVYIYEALIQGKKVYSVLYNEYGSRSQAIIQLKNLGSELTKNGPYLRTVKGIRADIRKSHSLYEQNLVGAEN